jgi:hypothetical protein
MFRWDSRSAKQAMAVVRQMRRSCRTSQARFLWFIEAIGIRNAVVRLGASSQFLTKLLKALTKRQFK